MHAKVLTYVEYRDGGRYWRSHDVIDPAWEQIEAAVRRLDKFRFPILQLWPTDDKDEHVLVDGCECFEVIGGRGEYWIAASIGDYFQRRFFDPTGSNSEVAVWTSDQGFADEDRFICRDIDVVLRATRRYAECGDFDPLTNWE